MNRIIAQRLLRLYPKAWRDRFGGELLDMLECTPTTISTLIDVAQGAAAEWLFNPSGLRGEEMQAYPANVISLARKPSALIPLAMSLCAISIVGITFALGGAAHPEPRDEGTLARIFQLLLIGQAPFMLFFAGKWMVRDWKVALGVFAIQLIGICAAVTPVALMGW